MNAENAEVGIEYKATLDFWSKAYTNSTAVLFGIIGLFGILALIVHSNNYQAIFAIMLVFSIGIVSLLVLSLFKPDKYLLRTDAIIVKRIISDRTIDLSNMTEVRTVKKNELGLLILSFGFWSRGFFGYFGKLYLPRLGFVTLFATRTDHLILLTTKKQMYIISPDDLTMLDEMKRFGYPVVSSTLAS